MGSKSSKQKIKASGSPRARRVSVRQPGGKASLYVVDPSHPSRTRRSSSVLRFGEGKPSEALEKRRSSSTGLNFDPLNRKSVSARTSSHPKVFHKPGSGGSNKRHSSNRYEGLGVPKRVTPDSPQMSPGRSKIVEVPPPPPDVFTSTSEEESFIDYTIIPLLLRAEMEYSTANQFGALLKEKYPSSAVVDLMQNPFELFAALEKESFFLSNDLKMKVVEDKFWKQRGNSKRRTSFVYYKDDGQRATNSSKSFTLNEKRMSMKRESVRTEFGQQRALEPGEGEDFQLDMKVIRQSLKILGDLNDFSTEEEMETRVKKEKKYDDLTI